jgi:type IV pilus assembly protein PilZ
VREKRQYQRAQVSLEVVLEMEDGATLSAVSTDLSPGGMFIESTKVLPFGTNVVVVCSLPKLEAARLPAVVRWTKPGGFGVQFGLLGARETHAIGQVLRNAAATES